jgi:hypothetical protein
MERSTVDTAGLFFAWLGHDIEEFVTMRETSRKLLGRLPERVPVPAEWRAHGLPQRHIAVGMSTMGLLMAAASADGYRTGGRSAFYQTVLLGFGLHGIGHVGMAMGMRGYASGVLTSPTVVIPFWLAATRDLNARGVPPRRSVLLAALSIPVSVWAAHGVAYALTRRRAEPSSPDGVR